MNGPVTRLHAIAAVIFAAAIFVLGVGCSGALADDPPPPPPAVTRTVTAPPEPTTPPPPAGDIDVDVPNVDVPNPCRHTRWC